MAKKILIGLGIAIVLIIVGFIITLSVVMSFNPNKYEGNTEEKISQYIKDKEDFRGTVLVTKGDEIIFDKSYGFANDKKKIKNDEHTQYQIGSLTKSFTAAAILKLEEEGKLKTSDPIADYLPDFPRGKDITLHHLLTHTSGIYNYTAGKFVQNKKVTPEKIVKWFDKEKLEFEPGEKFQYSNSNYILLGMIIEKVSGMSYEQFLAENILKPAGLNETTTNRDDAKNLAIGYKGYKKDKFIDNSVPYAAGMVISTANDLLKYDKALYERKIVNEESLKKLFTPEKDDYAYGWINTEMFGEKVHWHNGGINGFRSIMSYFPDQGYTIIVLSNNVMENVDSAAMDISAILFNKKLSILDRF
ncbi:serine hydrolase [Bacillus sp. CGMCC 1.16607]|uniref:serine hydrolase domain-containing protein n=1 Tax=Bacillus sp. CGMCC 1.16607 TaxID=3351842 RepID=UPI00362EE514